MKVSVKKVWMQGFCGGTLLTLVSLLLVVTLAGGWKVWASPKKMDYLGRGYTVSLDRWIDGDSAVGAISLGLGVWLHDQHLRLARVDTPERGKEGFDEATRLSERTCPVGVEASIEVIGKGKYGRWLVEMNCDSVSLNDKLRLKGWKYDE